MAGTRSRFGPAIAIALLVLLVFFAFALLYAYRAQSPAAREIALSDALARIERGEVSRVTVTGNRAAIELRDGSQRFQVQLPDRDEQLAKTVNDHNRANPTRTVALKYEQESPTLGLIGSVLLSLLPVLVLIALILVAAWAFTRARTGERYELLTRLADLRDRGAITEEEFQREKRRILR